ncbi:MAG: hypothetical protein NC099_01370 [Corallococcus sp.]|nr:hypothetical protein [Corallococcus sp.]
MSLVLAPSEQLVKTWQYGTSKSKNGNFDYSLTVTNKRVVIKEERRNSQRHRELPVNNIIGVDMSYTKKINLAGILLIILGIVACVVGVVTMQSSDAGPSLSYVFFGAGIIGIIAGIVSVILCSRGKLVIKLYSDMDTDNCLGIYVNSIPPVFKKLKRGKVTKVSVDANVAKEIVETLGSIIIAK